MRSDVLVAMRLALLAVLFITLLKASPAKAGTTLTQSTCPVVIAQSGEYTLGTDVGPCLPGADGIDIMASNVTLHLNGHTISSTTCNASDGIHVLGTPLVPISMIRVLGPGTITNFGEDNGFTGVFGGFLAENAAGSFVKFTTVTTTACGPLNLTFGFVLQSTTSMWKLDSNVVTEPGQSSLGILIEGNDNTLVRNSVTDSLDLDNSNNNTVVNNTASNNLGGIGLTGTSSNNDIDANTTDNNTAGDGVFVQKGSTGNRLSGNKSFNNSPFDMEDQNANCDNNKWTGNHFNSSSQPCIH